MICTFFRNDEEKTNSWEY